jgi:NAD(P)-dependent dehydrogenase (short-subunit alcohol dehydrogenase family)
MDLCLKDKVVFVTGASSGIGLECATLFAEENAYVVIGYKSNKDGAEKLLSRIQTAGGKGMLLRIDLSSMKSIQSSVDKLTSNVGEVYSLVLNAGSNSMTPFDQISEAEWDQMFSINLKGPYFLLKQLGPIMTQGGSVVFVASIAGQMGAPGHAHYAASKAGMINLSKSAAKYFASRLRVNCVSPGITMTPMGQDAVEGVDANYVQRMLLSRRFADPVEIARSIVFIASPAASFIYGATIDVNGGRELR